MRYRESTPLWVWLTFGLMSVGAALYMAGYLMIDDFLQMTTSFTPPVPLAARVTGAISSAAK
jgi:hypothetical protein